MRRATLPKRNTVAQPDRVTIWPRGELPAIDGTGFSNIRIGNARQSRIDHFPDVEDNDASNVYFPSLVYGSSGVDARKYIDHPVVLLPDAADSHPYKYGRIQDVLLGTRGALGLEFAGTSTVRNDIPLFVVQLKRVEDDDVEGLHPFNEGEQSYIEGQLRREAGIHILTSPAELDTDNYKQEPLPTGWSAVPNFAKPIYEKGKFLCFSRFIEPKIAGGTV